MYRTMKKTIGLLLAVIMIFSMMPISAIAAADSTPAIETTEQSSEPAAETDNPGIATPTSSDPTPPAEEPAETPPPESEPPAPEPTPTKPGETEQPAETEMTEPKVEAAQPITVTPELVKVVSKPLVNVVYHYFDSQQGKDVQSFAEYKIVSSHTYSALALRGASGIDIIANHFPDKVPVSTDDLRFRVLLNAGAADEQDVTSHAAYSNGLVTLPEALMGHRLTVEWYCPATEIVELPIEVTICVNKDGKYTTTTERLRLASNSSEISVPVSAETSVVVSQNGIDLDKSQYSVKNGVLNIKASVLGGDMKVSAYTSPAPNIRGFSIMAAAASTTTIDHHRGEQIYYGYYTSYYTANGNTAFCLDPTVSGVDSGSYSVSRWLVRGQDNLLIKCAYYLYGGPGYDGIKNSLFSNPNSMEAYGLCHAAAAYVYLGDSDAFKGLDSSTINHLIDVLNIVGAQPMPPEGFEAFLYNYGSTTSQTLMSWEYAPEGDLEIQKVSNNPAATNGNSCYSLEGAVFSVYNSSNQLVGTITTDSNGRGRLEGLPVGSGYYIVETKPPKGFVADPSKPRVYFAISSGQTTNVQITNIAQGDPASILLRKKDAQLPAGQTQGSLSLAGAQFTVKYYKGIYTTASALSGQTPFRTWVFQTDADGFIMLHPNYKVSGDALFYDSSGLVPTLPLGTVTIQETKPPTGFILNDELFIRTITSEGQMETVNTYNEPTVPEEVIHGGVSIEKWVRP